MCPVSVLHIVLIRFVRNVEKVVTALIEGIYLRYKVINYDIRRV